MITYAAYAPRNIRLGEAAIWTIAADTFASFLAAFAIFPLVFSYGLDPAGGPGLMFTTLPIAFGQMPGGAFVGAAFFLLLVVSALGVGDFAARTRRRLGDRKIWGRPLDAPPTPAPHLLDRRPRNGVVVQQCGAHGFRWPHSPTFETKSSSMSLDHLTSNVMLPLGGIFLGLFVGWVMSKKAVLEELGIQDGVRWQLLRFLLGVVCPVGNLRPLRRQPRLPQARNRRVTKERRRLQRLRQSLRDSFFLRVQGAGSTVTVC